MVRTVIGLLAGILALGAAVPGASAEGPVVSLDVATDGNDATTAGTIDDCVAVEAGAQFSVDIVITDVTDLLAWEMYVRYDPAVLRVIQRDVQLFLMANSGSSVLDVSEGVPDADGAYNAAAVDTSDPPRPDSGTGVLGRLVMEAVGTGVSTLSIDAYDLNGDGAIDRGVLLRDVEGTAIGDTDGDSLFDGETQGATVMVGGKCAGAGGTLMQGDLDCSRDVSAVDALAVLSWVAGLPLGQGACHDIGSPLAGQAEAWGDVNCDGDVGAVDALAILRHTANLPFTPATESCPAIGSDIQQGQ